MMATDKIIRPSIEAVRATQPHAQDTFFLCDIGGLLETSKRIGCPLPSLEHGMPQLTKNAEKYMKEFESDIFLGQGWQNRDEVVGALPNVPAYLAGHPHCMRTRHRTKSARGPLSIFFELTGSSGSLNTRPERGAAMLSLVHLLANSRPVDFWTLTTYGCSNVMKMVACKLDSQPLDTARAIALLADQQTLTNMWHFHTKWMQSHDMWTGGGWSYGHQSLERAHSGEALKRIVAPDSEILFIPAAYLSDFTEPRKWIRSMLNKYGMSAVNKEDE